MRIAMFTNTYPPDTGGVASSVKTLVDACIDRFHPTLVIAPGLDGGWRHPLPEVLAVPALFSLGAFSQVAAPNAGKITTRLRKFQPDVIHTHQPHLLAYTAAQVALNLHCPLVLTWHTQYYEIVKENSGSHAAGVLAAISALGFAKLCTRVTTPSNGLEEQLHSMGVRQAVVIPNGIDVAAFARADGVNYRARHQISAAATVVGHVGRLSPEKNITALAKVLQRLPAEVVVLIVGDGPSRAELEHALPKAHFVGIQKGADLTGAYAAMDCFVTASRFETDGLVVKEALAAGTPVAAYVSTGISENVRSGIDGVLCDTRQGLIAALVDLCRDRQRLRHFGNNARTGAQRFGRAVFAERMLALYRQVTIRKENVHASANACT